MNQERESLSLNKYIADSGVCSRREADVLINEGRITINGEVAVKGNRVFPGDEVAFDGEKVKAKKKEKANIYLLYNKPKGITCTTDEKVQGNIIAALNFPKRIFPVGRLDKASEGLIIMTNDGDIVNKINRAGNKHEKEYVVKVDKAIDPQFIRGMSDGVPILGTKTLPCEVEMLNKFNFKIVLKQGLNRQIRRMCEHFGYKVKRLERVRIMDLHIDDLPRGAYRKISGSEINNLMDSLKGSSAVSAKQQKQHFKKLSGKRK